MINKPIFPALVSIHGFSGVSRFNHVIAHAARMVALLQLQFCSKRLLTDVDVVKLHNFQDWIWDSCWLSRDTPLLAVACGYSKTWIGQPPHFDSFVCIHSDDSQLTWSSTVFGDRASDSFYVVSGTSFGELLIWKLGSYDQLCSLALSQTQSACADANPRQPHRLHAHHGPITRITMSSDAQFMTSVSVDRSVRIWHASQPSNCPSCPSFGCYSPILTHFGHLGRVWDVAFLYCVAPPTVASVSEDRTCRVWSGQRESQELSKYRDHTGNVWSIAVVDCPDKNSIFFATGGEDGVVKIRLLPRHRRSDGIAICPVEDPSDTITSCTRLPGKLSNPRKFVTTHSTEESGRTILMTSSQSLLISTDFGRILAASWASSPRISLGNQENLLDSTSWNEIFRDCNGTAFTPCSLILLGNVVCGGQVDGFVVTAQLPLQHNLKGGSGPVWKRFRGLDRDSGMVMGLFGGSPAPDRNAYDIFVAAASGNLHHWCIQTPNDSLQEDRIACKDAIVCQKITTYAAHRSTKSALVTNVNCLRDKKLVIVGDRGGRIHVFRIPPETDSNVNPSPCHALCWRRLHNDRISYFRRLGCFEILSCGFDGRIIVTTIKIPENNRESAQVVIERSDRTLEHVDTIVKVFSNVGNVDNLVAGFRGAVLSIWDIERRVERFQHNVGNWRRAYDIWCDNFGNVSMGYWRAGQLFVTSNARKQTPNTFCNSSDQLLANCGGAEFHGGKANDIVWVGEGEVMSAGEDTSIRITRVNAKYKVFEKIQCLDGHISSVSGLSVRSDSKIVVSCGGADEVLLWERNERGLWRLETRIKVGDIIHSNALEEGQSGNGAVMRVTAIAGGFDRIISTERWHAWVVGRSDGQIVELRTKRLKENWSVFGKVLGAFSHEAVLSACCSDNGNRTICGGSGGTIMIWDEHGKLIYEVKRGHEGGVNCLAVRGDARNDGTIVVSGGDDGKIKLWAERIRWHVVANDGHHAAVTGIAWVEGSGCLFVSGGTDRRVCVWRMDGEGVQLLRRIVTAVPDLGALIARVGTRFMGTTDESKRVHKVTRLCDDPSKDEVVVEVVLCGLGLEALCVRLHN